MLISLKLYSSIFYVSEDNISKIKIIKKIPFLGSGDSLEKRLRKVTLRGFPDTFIYKNSTITLESLSPEEIKESTYTPQPHVYNSRLESVYKLSKLFEEHGIDIFQLSHAYDYYSISENGQSSIWTMLPPVIEHIRIPQDKDKKGFDYSTLIGKELQTMMDKNGWKINPLTNSMNYSNPSGEYSLVNDGTHRVQAALELGKNIKIIKISDMTPGFPYYAVPQSFKEVQIFSNEREARDLKIHVLTAPGQKQLYRLFPSSGILSGSVRPARKDEKFI